MAHQSEPTVPASPLEQTNQQDLEADPILPPAKRQRLSPSPASPIVHSPQTPQLTTPTLGNITLPQGAFNHSRPPTNGFNTFRSSQPPPLTTPTGSMGPPQRPVERPPDRPADRSTPREERPLDINEINDLVASSGINIRDEEDYLYASYRNDRHNQSFRTDSTSHLTSAENSFDILSKSQFTSIGSSHGSFQHQPPSQSQEEELNQRHRKAARDLNERYQYHLDNPFLWGASVRKYLEKAANSNNVRMPIEGLWDRVADRPEAISGTSAKNPDGTAVQQVRAPSLLTRGAPMEAILSLLSIAANERLRGLLEDSYGLARGRILGSDGVVPPQWADLAVKDGTKPTETVAQSISKTSWDASGPTITDKATNGDKHGLPSPPATNPAPSVDADASVPTVEVRRPNRLSASLMSLSKWEREAEERRLKVRAARRSKKAAQVAQAATSSAATPESGTPAPADSAKAGATTPGERAPDPSTKKEKAKAAYKDISEEVATRNANLTASMQVGGKKYSWLQSKPSTPALPSGLRSSAKDDQPGSSGKSQTQNALESAPAGSAERRMQTAGRQDRKFGEYREDGVGARGIQLKDWISILEADGRERTTLAHALAGLDEQKKTSASDQRPANGP